MSIQKLTYALIGCGRIAPNHIQAAHKQNEKLNIVAVCDPIASHRQNILNKLSFNNTTIAQYSDYSDMLKKEKPTLCAIATESGKHAQIAIDCLEAGSNVIIEKPIALSLKDADAILDCAQKKNLKVCACHQNRFNKSIQQIRIALENGRFGKLYYATAHIRWNREAQYYEQAPWRGTWAQDGGALMNQCIHNIDLLRWMMGDDICEVFAYIDQMAHPYIQAEDLGLAMVRFANGSYGTIEGTTDVFPKNLEETLYIFGENGTVKAGGQSVNRIDEWFFRDEASNQQNQEDANEEPPNVYGFGHIALYEDVIDAILHNRSPYVDGEAGRRALELVLAIYQSALTRQSVKLPLREDFSTLDMQNFRFNDSDMI